MWSGGTMANGGEMNPFIWNYDAKTLGYMAGGALVGAASGGAAGAVATSGMVGAKTAAIVTGSFVNSVGTHIYTGGQTDVSVSFGFGSFNLTNGTADGIWNWGENSTMENIGYGLGALVNAVDFVNAVDGAFHFEDKMRAKYEKGYGDANCYNDESLGNNLGFGKRGLRPSFPGPNNPTGYNAAGKLVDYYGPVPNGTYLEYPGFIHDVAYAKLGIEGAQGLFTSLKAIPADFRFVGQSLYLGTKHLFNTPFLSMQSYALGIGLGAAALPKALLIPTAIYGLSRLR